MIGDKTVRAIGRQASGGSAQNSLVGGTGRSRSVGVSAVDVNAWLGGWSRSVGLVASDDAMEDGLKAVFLSYGVCWKWGGGEAFSRTTVYLGGWKVAGRWPGLE